MGEDTVANFRGRQIRWLEQMVSRELGEEGIHSARGTKPAHDHSQSQSSRGGLRQGRRTKSWQPARPIKWLAPGTSPITTTPTSEMSTNDAVHRSVGIIYSRYGRTQSLNDEAAAARARVARSSLPTSLPPTHSEPRRVSEAQDEGMV